MVKYHKVERVWRRVGDGGDGACWCRRFMEIYALYKRTRPLDRSCGDDDDGGGGGGGGWW